MSPIRWAKALVFGLFFAAVSPLVLLTWLEKKLTRGEQLFTLGAHCVALVPGLPGAYARGAYYFGALDRCSWETHVGFGTVITHRAAALGRKASTGCYCVIGHADIGEGVMMGSRVSVPSGKRQHLDGQGRLSSNEGRFERVSIGAGSWIGEGAILLADVGARCIVSAGAVVTGAMPGACLIGGHPARVLRPLDAGDAAPGNG